MIVGNDMKSMLVPDKVQDTRTLCNYTLKNFALINLKQKAPEHCVQELFCYIRFVVMLKAASGLQLLHNRSSLVPEFFLQDGKGGVLQGLYLFLDGFHLL